MARPSPPPSPLNGPAISGGFFFVASHTQINKLAKLYIQMTLVHNYTEIIKHIPITKAFNSIQT